MKALLDEQLSGEIARLLCGRGLDVHAVVERSDIARAPDEQVMDGAVAEGRAVVTNNVKDFRPLAAQRIADGRGHSGLILVPAKRSRSQAATGLLADAIEGIMRSNPDGIADSEHWIPPLL